MQRIDDCDEKTLRLILGGMIVNMQDLSARTSVAQLRQIYRDLLYQQLRAWKEDRQQQALFKK
ncbi:MAG: hypothetical protein ABI347_12065 [Nitrososphaera sp.]